MNASVSSGTHCIESSKSSARKSSPFPRPLTRRFMWPSSTWKTLTTSTIKAAVVVAAAADERTETAAQAGDKLLLSCARCISYHSLMIHTHSSNHLIYSAHARATSTSTIVCSVFVTTRLATCSCSVHAIPESLLYIGTDPPAITYQPAVYCSHIASPERLPSVSPHAMTSSYRDRRPRACCQLCARVNNIERHIEIYADFHRVSFYCYDKWLCCNTFMYVSFRR